MKLGFQIINDLVKSKISPEFTITTNKVKANNKISSNRRKILTVST